MVKVFQVKLSLYYQRNFEDNSLSLAQLVEHMTVVVHNGYRVVTGSIPVAENTFSHFFL
jgi:hypothetical protein